MSKLRFIIATTLALMFLFAVLEVQCKKKYKDRKGRVACHRTCSKCPKNYCGQTPGCNLGPDMCLPVIHQATPLTLKIDLCKATLHLLDDILKNLSIQDLCIDIYWDTFKCNAPSTKIHVTYEKCLLTIYLGNVGNAVNCISLTICRLIKKLLG